MIFSERWSAPLAYWVIGMAVGLTSATAIGFFLDPWVAVAAGAAAAIALAGFLLVTGHPRTIVDAEGLRVGDSLLEWRYVGRSTALDRAATRRRLGRDADVRAFVATRPYLRSAVEVTLEDPADPHPYWVVGTRRPGELAAALEQGRRSYGVRSVPARGRQV